jgi:hypothetical protein
MRLDQHRREIELLIELLNLDLAHKIPNLDIIPLSHKPLGKLARLLHRSKSAVDARNSQSNGTHTPFLRISISTSVSISLCVVITTETGSGTRVVCSGWHTHHGWDELGHWQLHDVFPCDGSLAKREISHPQGRSYRVRSSSSMNPAGTRRRRQRGDVRQSLQGKPRMSDRPSDSSAR